MKSYDRLLHAIIWMIAAVVTAACGGFEYDLPSVGDKLREYPVVVNASQDAMTRISLQGNKLAWEQNDEIQLTAVTAGIEVSDTVGTSILKWFGNIDSDPSRASFTGFITLRSEPKSCYFTYPVGEALSVDAAGGTIKVNYTAQNGSHRPFLYGKTLYDENGMFLDMKHAGAMLELTVETEGVSRISFVGNSLESLSPIIINPDDDTISLPTEAVSQITVDVQANGKAYLFVPPVRFEKGFTLVCSKEDGSCFMKSYSDGSTGGYDFSAKRGVRIPLTISGTFESFALTAEEVTVYHGRNSDGLLTGTHVSFKLNKKGAPDKLIEGWGANLINERNEVVRTFSTTESVDGTLRTLAVQNNTVLLPAGTYVFQPYYIMYGSKVTIASEVETISISDPGVVLNINGTTSYDKYAAGNVAGANSHTNTLIAGLSVSTNVAGEIIASFTATMTGKDNKAADIGEYALKVENSNTVASYGDRHLSKFQSYDMAASITVGNMTFTAIRTFHITGLPYEVNFEIGDNTSWKKLGGAKYSDSRITFSPATLSAQDGAIISPAFHLPQNLNVKTSADVCCKSSDPRLNIKACANTTGSISFDGAAQITPHKISGWFSSLQAKGYIDCGTVFSLSASTPSLMYATTAPVAYNVGLFKIKIQYN